MSELKIQLLGNKICEVSHDTSDSRIITTIAKEFGGIINEFSSTDLLTAALGTCIATAIEDVLIKKKIQLEKVKIVVQNELTKSPKGIKSLKVNILIREDINSKVKDAIEKAAKTCHLYKSLTFEPQITVIAEGGIKN